MWPNDADGNAWADPKTGHAQLLGPRRLRRSPTPAGTRTAPRTSRPQIAQFKKAGVDILNGVMIPPDFTNFWKQAYQQGLKPPLVTIAKALLFPSALEAVGDIGYGLTTEVLVVAAASVHVIAHRRDAVRRSATPTRPRPASSGRSRSCTTPCSRSWPTPSSAPRTSTTRKPSSPPSRPPTSRPSAARSHWNGSDLNPVPNVCITPLVGGQWVKGEKYPFDLKIVENSIAPEVPINGELTEMEY